MKKDLELYKYLKEELKKYRKNIAYFNIEFLQGYLKDYKELLKTGSTTWRNCIASKLYNKNGACYCEFVTIAHKEKEKILNYFEGV